MPSGFYPSPRDPSPRSEDGARASADPLWGWLQAEGPSPTDGVDEAGALHPAPPLHERARRSGATRSVAPSTYLESSGTSALLNMNEPRWRVFSPVGFAAFGGALPATGFASYGSGAGGSTSPPAPGTKSQESSLKSLKNVADKEAEVPPPLSIPRVKNAEAVTNFSDVDDDGDSLVVTTSGRVNWLPPTSVSERSELNMLVETPRLPVYDIAAAPPAMAVPTSPSVGAGSYKRQRREWTPLDDARLVEAVQRYRGRAERDATRIGMTPWSTHLKCQIDSDDGSQPSSFASIGGGGGGGGGLPWSQIAREFPGRTASRCRERYINYLDPMVRREPFTAEEDEIILREHRLVGTDAVLGRVQLSRRENGSITKNRSVTNACRAPGEGSAQSGYQSRWPAARYAGRPLASAGRQALQGGNRTPPLRPSVVDPPLGNRVVRCDTVELRAAECVALAHATPSPTSSSSFRYTDHGHRRLCRPVRCGHRQQTTVRCALGAAGGLCAGPLSVPPTSATARRSGSATALQPHLRHAAPDDVGRGDGHSTVRLDRLSGRRCSGHQLLPASQHLSAASRHAGACGGARRTGDQLGRGAGGQYRRRSRFPPSLVRPGHAVPSAEPGSDGPVAPALPVRGACEAACGHSGGAVGSGRSLSVPLGAAVRRAPQWQRRAAARPGRPVAPRRGVLAGRDAPAATTVWPAPQPHR
eukprot:ctg_769.g374